MSPYLIDVPAVNSSSSERLVPVYVKSLTALREHVERFARYFLREMNTGGIQFNAAETEKTWGYVPYKAFLFAREGHFVGAACFRYRDYEDKGNPWVFDWIWICPFWRRRGVLAQSWPDINAQVGRFRLAHPVSPHMQAFLSKVGNNAAQPFT